MSSRKMSGARFVAETLKGYGVTTVFFVPSVLRASLLETEKVGIKKVLCHSEKAAAYMADGYARASRRPGIAIAQSVGAANMAAGLQDPYLGLSPVIALTGSWSSIIRDKHAYQEINHWPLYEPVTKFNSSVNSVDELPFFLRQAFREATSGAPGPVHLDLMGNDGSGAVDQEADLDLVIDEEFAQYPSHRPTPDVDAVKKALQLIEQASRPLILVGGGAYASDAGSEISRLAKLLSIPVATSLNGKGLFDEDDELSVGVIGTYSREYANKIASEGDLVLFLGSHTGGQVTNFWTVPGQNARIIQVDLEPSELGRNYPADVAILGDVKKTVEIMLDLVNSPVVRSEWVSRVSELKQGWYEETRSLRHSDAVPIRPERICNELTGFLPDNAILMSDTGHSGIWTGTMVNLTKPGQTYLRCAGSLGWGFPASLGAKCGAPERPVICYTGDGGFWYHLSEMETAVRCGINTITVINNNHALNQDRRGIENLYKDFPEGKSDEQWVFENINFAKIAETVGCVGIRVEEPGQIREALDEALTCGKPAIIDVVTDITAATPSPYSP